MLIKSGTAEKLGAIYIFWIATLSADRTQFGHCMIKETRTSIEKVKGPEKSLHILQSGKF